MRVTVLTISILILDLARDGLSQFEQFVEWALNEKYLTIVRYVQSHQYKKKKISISTRIVAFLIYPNILICF